MVLVGDLDRGSGARLQLELERIWRSETGFVILDLRPVEFMDSSGVQSLILANQRAQRDGYRLAVVAAGERISERLRRYGLYSLLDVAATPQEHLARPDPAEAARASSADEESD